MSLFKFVQTKEAGYDQRGHKNQTRHSSATADKITWNSIDFPSKEIYSAQTYTSLCHKVYCQFVKLLMCFLDCWIRNLKYSNSLMRIISKKFNYLIVLITFLLHSLSPAWSCPGRFVNPVTDICWSCLFPLTIGPVKIAGGREDLPNPSSIICWCHRPPIPAPLPGIPVGFWEPVRLVDVTRIPFCMVNLGGVSFGNAFYKHGTHTKTWDQKGGVGRSFYHVHWYIYPVIYWLELLMDFLCLESASFDVAYLTELDPLWNDDETAFILGPEAVVFGDPLAQGACAADCAAASLGFPLEPLFWCGGCQGSLYPFTGSVGAHIGGVQASLLLVQRMAAKLHRELLLWGSVGDAGLCGKYPMPLIRKSQYKTQMTYPIPTTVGPMACNPLGRTEVLWGVGREFPYQGEDFGYLVWRKRNCCVL